VDVDLLQVSLSLSYDIDPLYCILHDVVRRGGAGKRDLSCFLSVFICIDLAQCKGKSCIFGSVLNRDFPKLTSLSFSLRLSVLRHVMDTIVDRYYMTMKERLGASLLWMGFQISLLGFGPK
jgi:hypothetical protein